MLTVRDLLHALQHTDLAPLPFDIVIRFILHAQRLEPTIRRSIDARKQSAIRRPEILPRDICDFLAAKLEVSCSDIDGLWGVFGDVVWEGSTGSAGYPVENSQYAIEDEKVFTDVNLAHTICE